MSATQTEARAIGLSAFAAAVMVDDAPEDVLGAIARALLDVHLRDAVLMTLIPGHGDAAEAIIAGGGTQEVAAAMHALMQTHLEPTDASRTARQMLARAATVVPQDERSGAYALGAVLAWWEDDVAGAHDLALGAIARPSASGFRLGALILATTQCGLKPGWRK